ncbi:hypothetical protein [Saccharopolyspora spinosa]|uniref:hypothetical protein n=1 Tax=Saccharopolyspora spinosa TaxID=60894 RepID=UPI003BAA63ED
MSLHKRLNSKVRGLGVPKPAQVLRIQLGDVELPEPCLRVGVGDLVSIDDRCGQLER